MVNVAFLVVANMVALLIGASIVATVVPQAVQEARQIPVAGQGIAISRLTSTSVLIRNTGVVQVVLPSDEFTATLIDGVLYVNKVPVAPHTVLAGPANGTATATPTFRPLTSDDLPLIGAEKITGVLEVSQGGTGSGTAVVGGNLMISTVNGTIVEGPGIVECCLGIGTVTVVEAGDGIAVSDIGNNTYVVSTSGVAPISKGGTGSGAALVGDRVMLSDGVGQSLYESPPLFDGYLLVGSTGSAPVPTTITAGDGVIIGTGPGSIVVSATGTCSANQTFSHTCLDISGEGCTTPLQSSCIPQALSLTSLQVSGTTMLGSTTTCAAALDNGCVDISGKTCPGGVLGTNCIPQDLTLESLYVNNLIAVNSTQQTIIDANATIIQVEQLYVTGQIDLNGTMQCLSGPLSTDCVDISGHTCPGGALDASCLPADAVFTNLQSTGTLSVNSVTCLGSPLPDNCVDISGKTCTSTLAASCIPLRVATINGISPEPTAGDFSVTAGTGIVITPGTNALVVGNTGVTNVALMVPSSIMSVSGSPVTTTGTLTTSLLTQAANTLFFGPVSGASAAPAFRTQVLADLPQLTNGQLYVGSTGSSVVAATITAGTGITVTNGAGSITVSTIQSVTSVALSLPSIFSVSGSPVTSTGTLTGTLATQTANTVFAGPTSGGASGEFCFF